MVEWPGMRPDQLYAALATAFDAGLSLDRAVRVAAGNGSGPLAQATARIVADVRDGQTLAQAVARHPHLFPAADVTFIEVGEETGTLEAACRHLADWYEFKRRNWRTVVAGMTYPTVVIHVAALVIPAVPALLGQITFGRYVLNMLAILACFYVPIAGALLAYRWFTAQPGGRRRVDALLLRVPVLGVALRDLALSRYCRNFRVMYVAGAGPDKCSAAAVRICGNGAVATWLEGGAEAARSGHEVSTGFSSQVPQDFLSLWTSAEDAGRLDDTLQRLADTYADSAEFRLQQIAHWVPRLIYAAVAVFLVLSIMRLATGVMGAYRM